MPPWITRPTNTVTVTRHGRKRFTVTFSQHPGHTFGPWDLTETTRDLTISALLERGEARDLVLKADANGSATAPVAG